MTKEKNFKEIFFAISVVLGLIVLHWRLLVTKELMVSHDSIIWYGIFEYFVDNLQHGVFPFWNPYMNCGEIFFLNISVMHLLDPSTLILILVGKLLSVNLLQLYHYDLFLRYVIFTCGAYFFYRHVAKYKISALIAFLTISFSSLCISYLRQHAFILTFYLFPWILFSAVKFLKDKKPRFLLLTAFFSGIAFPSYHSMFIIISGGILLTSLFLTKGLPIPKMKMFFKDYRLTSLVAFFIFFFLVMKVTPLYLAYTYDVIPTARIFEAPAAAHSFPADFFNLLTPYWFIIHFFNWGYMSESFLYIGLIPLLFSIIGLWFSHHKYKLGFILTTVIIVLLMLGDKCFIYPLFRKFFPFFSIIRNTHTFGPFFIFCLTYFTCLGMDVIFESVYTSKIRFYKKPIIFIAILICFLALLVNYRIFSISPFLTGRLHIINGYVSLTTKDMAGILRDPLYTSGLNVLLFAVGIVIIFSLLKSSKININIKYFAIIFFVLIDLLFFNCTVYMLVTMPRVSPAVLYSNKLLDNDHRVPVIRPEYPFYAFAPAMLKIFTAYSTKIPWVTTHLYEMKDFFELIHNRQIPEEVKNILMGVPTSKIRLVPKGVVLPRNKIVEALEKIAPETAKQVIFIEENLPPEYSHLEKSLNDTNNKGLDSGKIEVKQFNPNEIVMNVYAEEDSFLYYSDTFDKAWKVFIDEKAKKVYKTNLAFKSVIVDKGFHTVHFVYDPKFYKFSVFCYFAGLTLLIIIFICLKFRRKRLYENH